MTHKINPALANLARPVGELKADPNNARKHDERNIDAIMRSLDAFGQQKPCVVRGDGTVIAGNGMLEAARRLGWTHLAAVKYDKDSAEEMVRGYHVADNRSGDLSAFDDERLAAMLDEVRQSRVAFTIQDLGFTDDEVAAMLEAMRPKRPPDEFPEYDESIRTEHTCPRCGYSWSGGSMKKDGG